MSLADGRLSGPTDRHSIDCRICSQSVPEGAAFCPWCGSDTRMQGAPPPPLPPVFAEPDAGAREAVTPTVAWDKPTAAGLVAARAPRRRGLMIAVAAITALALVAGALWLFLVPNAVERQLASSTASLAAAAQSLADATTMDQVRTAGAQAAQPASDAEAFLSQMDTADQPVNLVLVSGALSAIASLEDVTGEAPLAWDGAKSGIRDAAAAELPVEGLGATLLAAAESADRVIADAAARFAAWQAENAEAVAARDDAIRAAERYQSSMQDSINDYIDLRNDLSDYIDIVDNEGSTVDVAYYEFADAAAGRRAVRDDMASLTPPAAASAAHGRLLSVIADGIAGVESAERALDVAVCDWDYCNVTEQTAWWNFRDESRRITVALDDAIAAWKAAAAQAVADAEAMPLPPKPEL